MKKALIFLVLIALIGGIMYFSGGQAPQPQTPTQTTVNQASAPTGNINDAVTAILADIVADEPAPTETDATLTAENDQALNGFGQTLSGSSF